jgi:hypothetical protein
MYKSGIDIIEVAFRLSEAKSSEDYRRMVEEFWRKVFAVYKDQSETQIREFQKGVEKWFDLVTKTPV